MAPDHDMGHDVGHDVGQPPEISVVIPTYNRSAILRRTLETLAAQDLDPERYEILVVDDGSPDDTQQVLAALAAEHPRLNLRVFRQANQLSGAARNLGIREARGRLVLSMDDDLLAKPDFLAQHLAVHERHPAESDVLVGWVITGDQGVDLCDPDERPMHSMGTTEHGQPIMHPAGLTTQNTSFKRSFLLAGGLFTPGLPRLDDLDLSFRLEKRGMRLLFGTEPVLVHLQPLDSVDKVVRMGRFYGSSLADCLVRLPHLREAMPYLGARFDGGMAHFRADPSAYVKDAVRRVVIRGPLARLLEGVTRRLPVSNPPGRLMMRCCRELRAFHYRDAFQQRQRELGKLNRQADAAGSGSSREVGSR